MPQPPYLFFVPLELIAPVDERGEDAIYFSSGPIVHLLGLQREPSLSELVNYLCDLMP